MSSIIYFLVHKNKLLDFVLLLLGDLNVNIEDDPTVDLQLFQDLDLIVFGYVKQNLQEITALLYHLCQLSFLSIGLHRMIIKITNNNWKKNIPI